MEPAMMRFPKEFLWGTATSSHQVEGNNRNNDWWEWEKEPGHIRDGHRSELACDWWNRAEQDFDLVQEMGQNAHRLSLEWSRIEPQEGKWDDGAIARYRQMLAGLRERGLEPMVTLHHFTNPLWLVEAEQSGSPSSGQRDQGRDGLGLAAGSSEAGGTNRSTPAGQLSTDSCSTGCPVDLCRQQG
jgi:beta-glucosidase/6-phospho-beta-glucosidase/beta-galactosidase